MKSVVACATAYPSIFATGAGKADFLKNSVRKAPGYTNDPFQYFCLDRTVWRTWTDIDRVLYSASSCAQVSMKRDAPSTYRSSGDAISDPSERNHLDVSGILLALALGPKRIRSPIQNVTFEPFNGTE